MSKYTTGPRSSTADLLLRNARVYTVDPTRPWAGAVAVRSDRVVWVGDDQEAAEHGGPGTEVLDAGGRLVLPGIVDSHNHVRLGAVDEAVQLHDARTLEEILDRIAAWVTERPDVNWIEGTGWNYTAIPGGRPRAELLDPVAGERPACLFSYDVHTAWLNRPALERFGITREHSRARSVRWRRTP